MAYAEVGNGTGNYFRTATGAYTVTGTLSAAPSAAGHWIAVAVYNSRMYLSANGGLPLSTVKCGTVDLVKIETAGTGSRPELWMAPYQAGMTTSVVMSGNVATTTATGNYGYAMLVFSGASTGTTVSGSWNAFRQTNGLGMFDGGGTNTFGAVNASGTTLAGYVSWTNSNNAIPNNYTISGGQGEPWLATVVQTNSFNPAQYKTTTLGPVVATLSGLSFTGQYVYYLGTSGWFNNNQIVLNSTTSVYAGGLVSATACAPSGNYQFFYNGTATFAGSVYLNNCFLVLGLTDSTPVANFTLPSGTVIGCPLSAQNTLPVFSHNSDDIAGTGTTVQGNATTMSRVMTTITGNTSVLLGLMAGYTTVTGVNISGKMESVGGSNTPSMGGAVYTMVPNVRTLVRTPTSVISSDILTRTRNKIFNRIVRTSQSLLSSTRKYSTFIRKATASFSEFSRVSKTRIYRRLALALNSQLLLTSKGVAKSVAVRTALTELVVTAQSLVLRRSTRVLQNSLSKSTGLKFYSRSINILQNSLVRVTRSRLFSKNSIALSANSSTVHRSLNITRFLETISSSLSAVRRNAIRRREVQTIQIVSATIVRNRSYSRGVQVRSSYTIGASKTSTFVRRAMASSSAGVQVARALGKNYLITSTAIWHQATSGSVKLLIPVVALWRSAQNTTTKLLIRANAIINENIFVSSDDWVETNNGQPTEGNETEIFDDVPETVNEELDQLGTDVVPLHE